MFAGEGQELPDSPQDFPDFFQACVWQHERCPSTGRLHAQMYAEFNRRVELSTLQNWWPGLHVEVSRGSAEQNKKYCTKDETRVAGPWTFGDFKKQGLRTDLNHIHDEIAGGASLGDVLDNHFDVYVRYRGGIEAAIRHFNGPKVRRRPDIQWFYGEPGTGKSRNAWYLFPDAHLYSDNKDGWFGVYSGQETVILDDFEGNTPANLMLRLFDYTPCTMPVKGLRGGAPIAAWRFIVTSNLSPEECYPFSPPFQRRIREFGTVLKFPEDAPIDFDA